MQIGIEIGSIRKALGIRRDPPAKFRAIVASAKVVEARFF